MPCFVVRHVRLASNAFDFDFDFVSEVRFSFDMRYCIVKYVMGTTCTCQFLSSVCETMLTTSFAQFGASISYANMFFVDNLQSVAGQTQMTTIHDRLSNI